MKLFFVVLLGLLSASRALPQQVGSVDLTRPESVHAVAEQNTSELPPSCAQPTGIMANGWMKPKENQPRISVEIVNLSSQTLEVGGEGQVEIRLRNIGEEPIHIPWSTDQSLIQKAPSPDHLRWEQGRFTVALGDKQSHTIALKSAGWRLFGSDSVNGSVLTINPGEWVTAFLKFKVEDLYRIISFTAFPVGERRVFVEWEQALRTWDRENCGWNRTWFDYEGYYKQESPAITVQISRSASDESSAAK